ncbi:MAG: HIT domain-containing protein [Patescibacteria group bacterium]
MKDCVFCKIANGEISTGKEEENDSLVVVKDINPRAPIHLLIIPKKHVTDILETDDTLWIEIKKMAIKLSEEKKLIGFRLVHNAGSAAIVQHMHIHFLAEIGADREI